MYKMKKCTPPFQIFLASRWVKLTPQGKKIVKVETKVTMLNKTVNNH